jgi:rRNA pseudouridine-1189 N-methylase Emg1 (Nep1/Mra1 family)
MASHPTLWLEIDVSDLSLDEKCHLPASQPLEFVHQVLLTMNKTSLWQCGRIRALLESPQRLIEVSPLIKIPDSVKDFRLLLGDVFAGIDVRSDDVKLFRVRKEAPPLPNTKFTVAPFSEKTIVPSSVAGSSVALFLSIDELRETSPRVCFSKFPLPPLNQCLNVVAAFEQIHHIQ